MAYEKFNLSVENSFISSNLQPGGTVMVRGVSGILKKSHKKGTFSEQLHCTVLA